MKRTDKYRDSYKYDNQYQNHKRRAEEDEYRNRAQSQNRPNAQRPNQHRDNRGFEDEPNVTTMAVTIVGNSRRRK